MAAKFHAASVHFPIGLLTGSWLVVVAGWLFPERVLPVIVTGALGVALLSSLPAVASGLWALVKLGSSPLPGVEKLVWWHLGLVGLSVSIFLFALFTHLANQVLWTATLATAGMVILLVGGHFGGKLVYQYAIGVEPGARDSSGGVDGQPTGSSATT